MRRCRAGRWAAPAHAHQESGHVLYSQPAISPSPWCLPAIAPIFFIYGMSSEGDTTGGERAAVPSAEEAPFSAEQLAWIHRLIAARHTGPFVSPAPRLRPHVSPPLFTRQRLRPAGGHGSPRPTSLPAGHRDAPPPPPLPSRAILGSCPQPGLAAGGSLCKHAYGMAHGTGHAQADQAGRRARTAPPDHVACPAWHTPAPLHGTRTVLTHGTVHTVRAVS